MWILIWLILAIVVGVYASNKGLSGGFYFFLSLLLSPLVGFVIAAASRRDTEVIAERTGMKKCPDCAEFVQGEALVCRFCGHKFAITEWNADLAAEKRLGEAARRAASHEDQSQKEQERIQQQTIARNDRLASLTIAVVVLVTAVFLLVHSTYIALAIIVAVTLVLLLAFYPKSEIKRPGPAAHI